MTELLPSRYEVDSGNNFVGSGGGQSSRVGNRQDGQWWTREEARLYELWRGDSLNTGVPFDFRDTYFDNYFSGSDVIVRIDGMGTSRKIRPEMKLYSLGYQIQQEKAPLYGYASYTYDAVMRGVRIVSGAFSLVISDDAHDLEELLSYSSSDRLDYERNDDYEASDRELVDRFWSKNFDSNLDPRQKHLFSRHPPFNLEIYFGTEATLSRNSDGTRRTPENKVEEIRAEYLKNNLRNTSFTNVNERLVNTSFKRSGILIENLEIISKSTQFDSSGDPVMNTYSFFARDEREISDDRF